MTRKPIQANDRPTVVPVKHHREMHCCCDLGSLTASDTWLLSGTWKFLEFPWVVANCLYSTPNSSSKSQLGQTKTQGTWEWEETNGMWQLSVKRYTQVRWKYYDWWHFRWLSQIGEHPSPGTRAVWMEHKDSSTPLHPPLEGRLVEVEQIVFLRRER